VCVRVDDCKWRIDCCSHQASCSLTAIKLQHMDELAGDLLKHTNASLCIQYLGMRVHRRYS
jgi:hypothetical protein